MFMWLTAFLAMTVLDVCWGKYVRAAANRRPVLAASWAVLLYALTAYLYVSIVGDPWLTIPACAGAFAGTYIGVKY
jgi:uncharacterized membrane protein YfcA